MCDFKNCPLCKARDDFLNQLTLDLMQDMLPLTLTEVPEFVPLTQEDFVWDIENEDLTF